MIVVGMDRCRWRRASAGAGVVTESISVPEPPPLVAEPSA